MKEFGFPNVSLPLDTGFTELDADKVNETPQKFNTHSQYNSQHFMYQLLGDLPEVIFGGGGLCSNLASG